jgi:hypothetical protein
MYSEQYYKLWLVNLLETETLDAQEEDVRAKIDDSCVIEICLLVYFKKKVIMSWE